VGSDRAVTDLAADFLPSHLYPFHLDPFHPIAGNVQLILKMIIARKNGDLMYLARPTTDRDRFGTSPHVEKIEILWHLPISLRETNRPAHHLFPMDVVS
jgi:hypothetical protein